jgi:hypothetical protein
VIKPLLATLLILAATGCHETIYTDHFRNPVVGTWFVEDAGAPFHQHMYVFNADGTMQQSNPDSGVTLPPATAMAKASGEPVATAYKVSGWKSPPTARPTNT